MRRSCQGGKETALREPSRGTITFIKGHELSLQGRNDHNVKSPIHPSRLFTERQAFEQILDIGSIEMRTDTGTPGYTC
jgi:hypothetical protein